MVVPDAAILQGPFTGLVSASYSNPIAGKKAWCGGAAVLPAMSQVRVNLAAFAGVPMKIRWHEGDDSSAAATGWYVESVTITNAGVASPCNATPVELVTFAVD